ncbi:MAG: MoaD/ThiS family protein [Eubacteriales bacterium]
MLGEPVRVNVVRLGVLDEVLRNGTVEVPDGSTVRDLIRILAGLYGNVVDAELLDEGRLREPYRILVNGRNTDLLQNLLAPLKDDDTVLFTVLITGG